MKHLEPSLQRKNAYRSVSGIPKKGRVMARTWFRGVVVLAILVVPALVWADKPSDPPGLAARVAALEEAVTNLQNVVAVLKATVKIQAGKISVLDEQVVALQQTDAALGSRLASVENSETMKLNPFLAVTTDEEMSLPLIRFTGVNLQLVNGEGPFPAVTGAGEGGPFPAVNGLGNLIIGYNEAEPEGGAAIGRSGSHNIVVGPGHGYSSSGGLVAGLDNKISGHYASVTGGHVNQATADFSSVSGGGANRATGFSSSISGGYSSQTTGSHSSVSGGFSNLAAGRRASVSGGQENQALQDFSSVSGGLNNFAGSDWASVSGGKDNAARGLRSSVSGGRSNVAWGNDSSVSGGQLNQAAGFHSSVSGGAGAVASDPDSWAAGGLHWPIP